MNNQRLLDTFLDLVRISSPSKREAAVAAYCKTALEQAGCTVRIDGSGANTGSDTGNIQATLPGTAPGKLYFSAHMDTVNPCENVKPIIQDGIIRSSGDTILGGDDKSGIAAIIELLRTLQEEGKPHPEVGVLISTCEEIGLLGAHHMEDTDFKGEPCFVLDGAEKPGTVVIGAPYHLVFEATFTGKASHAGAEPEKGLSAIILAAKAIGNMELGRLSPSATANVGTINGGNATNVVPSSCVITGEFRVMDKGDVDGIKKQLDDAMNGAVAGTAGSVEITWKQEYPGFILPEDDPFILAVLDQAHALGFKAQAVVSGGGSDANVYTDQGLRAVVLGNGMADIHSLNESMAIQDLEDLTRFCVALTYAQIA